MNSERYGSLSSWWTRIVIGILMLIFIGIQSLFYAQEAFLTADYGMFILQ